MLRKSQKMLGGYFILPHPVYDRQRVNKPGVTIAN